MCKGGVLAKDLGIEVNGGLSNVDLGNDTTELTVLVLAGLGIKDTECPFPFDAGYTVLEDSVGEKVEYWLCLGGDLK